MNLKTPPPGNSRIEPPAGEETFALTVPEKIDFEISDQSTIWCTQCVAMRRPDPPGMRQATLL
jgi:hypothetical protein